MARMETSYLDWLSAVGGLSSIVLGLSQLLGNLESAQMYTASSMFYPSDNEDGGEERIRISRDVHTPEDA